MRKNNLIVGLDIGSAAIKSLAVCPREEGNELEVLSQVSQPCLGIRRGVVVDIEKTIQTINSVLRKTEEESGQKIEEVFVNIGGGHIFSSSSRGTIAVSRADQKISKEDIDRVVEAAQTFSLPPNREILDVFPKEFIVDGEKDIRQAVGMEGVRLEAEILVLGCFTPYFKNLTKAVLDAGVQIGHITPNPLASAKSVLTAQEKELGVLLLDIGAGTTSFCVFKEGVLLSVGVVPIGSFHITKDIATGLETDVETAEKIKLQFGACFLRGAKKIKIKEVVSGELLSFSQKKLGQIIDARVEEIFEQVQKELKKMSSAKLPGGIVVTGGGANLSNIKEFARKSLKMTARLGFPQGFFPAQKDLQLACVAGLTLIGREMMAEEAESWFNIVLQFLKKIFKIFVP